MVMWIKIRGIVMKVIKRNGSEVEFDKNKIIVAITKANEANVSHELTPNQIKEAADYIEYKCDKLNRAASVEEIQDMVENQIMANGAFEVAKEYEKITGRKYGLFEEYRMEDAERAVVIIGSAAGTTKDAVDRLREQGEKVGLIKIRLFRPFPADEIAEALKNVKAIAIMDRAESYTNHGGPLGADVMSALFRARSQALAINYVYGLGGRDVRVEDMENVYETLKQVIADGDAGEMYRYMGIRE